ncbi:MAG: DUF2752 domain-containing protein [Clostridia bacterium]|nr:DUF2752 domain-containing protein [Clostridia bacterium]
MNHHDKKQALDKQESAFFLSERHIKYLPLKLIFFGTVLILGAVLYKSGIGCIWRYFFGVPCPGCGITRAYISAFKGDFKAAFGYNYMFISIPLVILYILYDGRLFKSPKADAVLLSLLAFGFLIHWLSVFI